MESTKEYYLQLLDAISVPESYVNKFFKTLDNTKIFIENLCKNGCIKYSLAEIFYNIDDMCIEITWCDKDKFFCNVYIDDLSYGYFMRDSGEKFHIDDYLVTEIDAELIKRLIDS